MFKRFCSILYGLFLISCRTPVESIVSYDSKNFPTLNFEINNNQAYTDNPLITVNILGELNDITSYRLFSDNQCSQAEWVPLVNQLNLSLEETEGNHFISLQVRSKLNFESPCITKSIYLDQSPPLFAGLPLSVTQAYFKLIDRSPLINWGAAIDAGSGVAFYKMAIGSSPGAADIMGWTNIGLETSYQATGLTLNTGLTYHISLRAVDNLAFESVVQSSQWVVDATAPPSVSQLRHYSSTNLTVVPTVTWDHVTDTGSGLDYYEIALGSAPGETNIKAWQNIGDINSYTYTGLNMSQGGQFFPSVRAVDRAGNRSALTTSAGWRAISKWVRRVRDVVSAPFFEKTLLLEDGSQLTVGALSGRLVTKVTSQNSYDLQFEANFVESAFVGSYSSSILIQETGHLVIGGHFNSFNGVTQNNIIRLNSNGTIDTSFNSGIGFNGSVSTIQKFRENELLIGGSFSSYQGFNSKGLMALNSNGSRSTNFNVGDGFMPTDVKEVLVTKSGLIYVGGGFTTYNSTPATRIVRLFADGSRDLSFQLQFNGIVQVLSLDSQGRIYVGGGFNYDGIANRRLVRLTSEGEIDTTFNLSLTFEGGGYQVLALAHQEDGRILVGGSFSTVQGLNYSKLVRLNENGSVDTTFNIDNGFQALDAVYGITILPNNKILVDGQINPPAGQILYPGNLIEW